LGGNIWGDRPVDRNRRDLPETGGMLQKMCKILAAAIRMKNLHTSEMPVGNKIAVLLDDHRNTSDP